MRCYDLFAFIVASCDAVRGWRRRRMGGARIEKGATWPPCLLSETSVSLDFRPTACCAPSFFFTCCSRLVTRGRIAAVTLRRTLSMSSTVCRPPTRLGVPKYESERGLLDVVRLLQFLFHASTNYRRPSIDLPALRDRDEVVPLSDSRRL